MQDKFKEIANQVTEEIIAELSKGNVIWKQPYATGGNARNYATGRPYEGFNQLYLSYKAYQQGFQAPCYLSYKQAQELGGLVRKGEKSVAIIYWKIFGEVSHNGENKTSLKFYPFYHSLFNIDQVEGIDFTLPQMITRSNSILENCSSIVEGFSDKPRIISEAAIPFYAPAPDCVNMPRIESFDSSEFYYNVFFHELIHSTGHPSRLNRFDRENKPAPFGSPEYSKEELIAELGAAFLSAQVGIIEKTKTNSIAYLQGWIKTLHNDHSLIITASNKAGKAAHYILGLNDCNEMCGAEPAGIEPAGLTQEAA